MNLEAWSWPGKRSPVCWAWGRRSWTRGTSRFCTPRIGRTPFPARMPVDSWAAACRTSLPRWRVRSKRRIDGGPWWPRRRWWASPGRCRSLGRTTCRSTSRAVIRSVPCRRLWIVKTGRIRFWRVGTFRLRNPEFEYLMWSHYDWKNYEDLGKSCKYRMVINKIYKVLPI